MGPSAKWKFGASCQKLLRVSRYQMGWGLEGIKMKKKKRISRWLSHIIQPSVRPLYVWSSVWPHRWHTEEASPSHLIYINTLHLHVCVCPFAVYTAFSEISNVSFTIAHGVEWVLPSFKNIFPQEWIYQPCHSDGLKWVSARRTV